MKRDIKKRKKIKKGKAGNKSKNKIPDKRGKKDKKRHPGGGGLVVLSNRPLVVIISQR